MNPGLQSNRNHRVATFLIVLLLRYYRAPGLHVKRSGEWSPEGPGCLLIKHIIKHIRPISAPRFFAPRIFCNPNGYNAGQEGCGVLGGAAEEGEAVCRRQRPPAAPSWTTSCEYALGRHAGLGQEGRGAIRWQHRTGSGSCSCCSHSRACASRRARRDTPQAEMKPQLKASLVSQCPDLRTKR